MSPADVLPDFSGLRVLVLSPTPTSPLSHGNRRRVHRVCRDIVEAGGDVVFALYASELEWRDYVPEPDLLQMQADWALVHIIPASVPLHAWPRNGAHHEIDEWWDPSIEAHLRHLFRTQEFDVVIVNYTWLSRALTLVPDGVLKVLDTHDVFSGRRELLERNGIAPEFFYLAGPQDERQALERADIVWAIKEEEAVFFRSIVTVPVMVLPHMDPPHMDRQLGARPRPQPDPRGVLRVGLIGADNSVNRVNTQRFLNALRRQVAVHFAPLELILAGSICDSLGLRADTLVQPLGRVDRVESFYADIDVAAVPMDFSTGLKIKAGEALGFGVATVATAHAFEGYEVHHPLQALQDIDAVARALAALSYAPERLEALRAAAQLSARTTRRTALQTLARTAQVVREAFRTLVLLDAGQLAEDGLRAACTEDLCLNLGYAGPRDIFVAHGRLRPGPKLIRLACIQRRLLIDPSVDTSALAGVAGLNLQPVPLDRVLEMRQPDLVFAETRLSERQRRALRLRRVELVARIPQVVTAEAAGSADPSGLLDGLRPRLGLMPVPTPGALAAMEQAGGMLIGDLLLMRSNRRIDARRTVPQSWNAPEALILADGDTPAARRIGQALADEGWNVVLADGSETAGPLPNPGDRRGQLRLAAMSWVAETICLSDLLPRVALDLSTGSGWRQFLREQLDRGGVPVLSIRPPGPRPQVDTTDVLAPGGPWQALRLMQRALRADPSFVDLLRLAYPVRPELSKADGLVPLWSLLMRLKRKEAVGPFHDIDMP